MAILKVMTGKKEAKKYRLDADETVLGRYPFCDIVLAEKNVSRQHTRVVKAADGFYVEDLNSLNGTFVNGTRIHQKTKLNDADRLHVYETLVVFYNEDDSTAADPPVAETAESPEKPNIDQDSDRKPESILNALNAADGLRIDVGTREKLSAILSINKSLGTSLDVEDVLTNFLEGLFKVFKQSDSGYILLYDDDGKTLRVRSEKSKTEGTAITTPMGPVTESLAERVLANGEAVLIEDALSDEDADIGESIFDTPVRSIMCAPLMEPTQRPLGLVYLNTSDADRQFDADDLEVLLGVSAVAGQAVDYTKMHQRHLQNAKREREMTMAKQVQQHFLPSRTPALKGYQFYNYYRPADDIGGDYHGYVTLPDGRIAITIADVSGKGISAALMMARLCSDVRFCVASSSTPAEAFRELNREVADPSREDSFVTMSIVILDPATHELQIVNAGHMPPLMRVDESGEVQQLGFEEAGPPLGCDETYPYESAIVQMNAGDIVLMYTDGVNEAMNSSDDLYSNARVSQVLADSALGARSLGKNLLTDVMKHIGSRAPSDDMCIVAFSRNES